MPEQAAMSTAGILGVIVLLLLGLGIAAYVFQNTDLFSWESLQRLMPDLVIPVIQDSEGVEGLSDILQAQSKQTTLWQSAEDNFYTSTHAACEIAATIRDDFAKNGEEKVARNRPFTGTFSVAFDSYTPLDDIGSGYTIIQSRVFPLFYDDATRQPPLAPKSFDLLGESAKKWLKTPGRCTDFSETERQFFSCPPNLNEGCITEILSHLKVPRKIVGSNDPAGGESICSTNGVYDDKRNPVYFGNVCPESEGGCNSCLNTVPEGRLLDKISEFVVEDSLKSARNLHCSDPYNPGTCNARKFRYVLYWDHKTKGKYYKVEILTSPTDANENDFGTRSIENVIELVTTNSIFHPRDSAAGDKYPDARIKLRFIFEPQSSFKLKDLVDAVNDRISRSDGWTTTYDTNACGGGDGCLKKNILYKRTIEKKSSSPSKEEKKLDVDWKSLSIKTTINPDSEFTPGNRYKIVIYNWEVRGKREEFPAQKIGCGYGSFPAWCNDAAKKDFVVDCADNAGCFKPGESAYSDEYGINQYGQYRYYKSFDNTIEIEELGAAQVAGPQGGSSGASPQLGTCTETDGGMDVIIKGTTTDAVGAYQDSCTGAHLTEYYCDGGTVKSNDIDCSEYSDKGLCSDGVCVA